MTCTYHKWNATTLDCPYCKVDQAMAQRYNELVDVGRDAAYNPHLKQAKSRLHRPNQKRPEVHYIDAYTRDFMTERDVAELNDRLVMESEEQGQAYEDKLEIWWGISLVGIAAVVLAMVAWWVRG
jgi:glutaredoxin